MKKSNSNKRPQTKTLMDVKIDKNKLSYESIEQDASGRILLHKSSSGSGSNGYGGRDEYYELSREEYEQYKKGTSKKGKRKR